MCNEAGTEAVELPCIGTADEPLHARKECGNARPVREHASMGMPSPSARKRARMRWFKFAAMCRGLVCSSGNCFRCANSIGSSIPIGCEYWAVDLDNAYVEEAEVPF